MEIIINNLEWIIVNVILAMIGVLLGWIFLKTYHPLLKVLVFIFWMLFLPNTIYLLTDLQYLPEQLLETEPFFIPILIIEYAVLMGLGVVTFIAGLYPLEKFTSRLKMRDKKTFLITLLVLVNFLIAFGVVLGKELRTHSWYVFTEFPRVVEDVSAVLTTPTFLLFVILFGIMNNLIYFTFRRKVIK